MRRDRTGRNEEEHTRNKSISSGGWINSLDIGEDETRLEIEEDRDGKDVKLYMEVVGRWLADRD